MTDKRGTYIFIEKTGAKGHFRDLAVDRRIKVTQTSQKKIEGVEYVEMATCMAQQKALVKRSCNCSNSGYLASNDWMIHRL